MTTNENNNDTTTTEHGIDILKRKLAVAEEMLENLKCCGNCGNLKADNYCPVMGFNLIDFKTPVPVGKNKCDKWVYVIQEVFREK